jgi:hypothetical protein
MPDTKITALTALTAADPANDMMPIVDVSDTSMAASGTTKRISINNILACSPTATLASATITGDLTVDTSTLKVDSTNNRVGIGTATPAAGYALDVRGILAAGNSAGTIIGGISFSTRPEIGAISNHNLGLIANNSTMHLITPAGVFDWYDGVGGTRMTLDSTGLGVGGSPTLTAAGRGNVSINGSTDSILVLQNAGATAAYAIADSVGLEIGASGSRLILFVTNSISRMRVKQNGQVRFVPLAADPAGAETGDVYYNSVSNKLKCYNGTTWNDLF